MPARRPIPEEVKNQVRQRANFLCEYCHASEQWQYVAFTIEHIIPLTKNGSDTLDNLALACFHCNRKKSNKTTAIEPQSNTEVSLFNPRQERWNHHFIWSSDGLFIVGLTPIGKATITALALNRERVINIRAVDKTVGRHPPLGDPIQPET
ncbi:MAG: HNH endonuclease signature motif containing protein [Cyanobacteriota bacterium]|nr:HNH endonuclease signature motif containing protein [Cyanobacteriota bacterium]